MTRPRREAEAAARRVRAEGAVPLADLTAVAGADAKTLLRWAYAGERGLYLDAVFDRRHGWFSSAPAVVRFLAAARGDGG